MGFRKFVDLSVSAPFDHGVHDPLTELPTATKVPVTQDPVWATPVSDDSQLLDVIDEIKECTSKTELTTWTDYAATTSTDPVSKSKKPVKKAAKKTNSSAEIYLNGLDNKYPAHLVQNINDGNPVGHWCLSCKKDHSKNNPLFKLYMPHDMHLGTFLSGWYCAGCIKVCEYGAPHAVPTTWWYKGSNGFCPRCYIADEAGNETGFIPSTPAYFKKNPHFPCCPCGPKTGTADKSPSCTCACHPAGEVSATLIKGGVTFTRPPKWLLDHVGLFGRPSSETETLQEAVELWDIDTTVCPAQFMADFYLVDAIRHGLVNRTDTVSEEISTVQIEAMLWQQEHVPMMAETFARYMSMVCGGELRHHPLIGDHVLDKNRTYAWGQWLRYCERVGEVRMLDVAVERFKDWGEKTSYGGHTWSLIASTVRNYRTGKMNAFQFCDRAFTLEHNGGCVFNKINWTTDNQTRIIGGNMMSLSIRGTKWQKPSIEHMKNSIGPAHAANPTDWERLYEFASNEVRGLFMKAWTAGNRARSSIGLRPIPSPVHAIVPIENGPEPGEADLFAECLFIHGLKLRASRPLCRPEGTMVWVSAYKTWFYRYWDADSTSYAWWAGAHVGSTFKNDIVPHVDDDLFKKARVMVQEWRDEFLHVSDGMLAAYVADQILHWGVLYTGDWNPEPLRAMNKQAQLGNKIPALIYSTPSPYFAIPLSDDDDEYEEDDY